MIANVAYHPDVLYRNEGDGTFRDVTGTCSRTATGRPPDSRPPGSMSTRTVGRPVRRQRLRRHLARPEPPVAQRGSRHGRPVQFTDVSLESGAGLYMNTMGIGIGDVDRDGDLDMALSNIGGNKLLRSDGRRDVRRGSWHRHRTARRRASTTLTVTWGTPSTTSTSTAGRTCSWRPATCQQAPASSVGEQPNMVFLNDGTGQRFLDVSALSAGRRRRGIEGRGVADYDNDGAMDVFVVNQAGSPRLYRNVTPRAGNHWLQVDRRLGVEPGWMWCARDRGLAGESMMRTVCAARGGPARHTSGRSTSDSDRGLRRRARSAVAIR